MLHFATRLFACLSIVATLAGVSATAAESWKAGVAKAVITPEKPMWMAGYGGRTEPAAGKYHDLWIRVLALEAADGHRGVILSSDTLGISQPIYEAVVQRLELSRSLTRSQIMLHASHTHCGPVLKQALYDTYPLDDAQIQLIEEYSKGLVDKIVQTIESALDDLQPATVSRGIGTCDFAVNRRTNREPTVPVLAVHRPDGTLSAVVFIYACHNTCLSWQQWCGDYAGFAQYALEERHPGAMALFTMGCGADQNPLPRRTVELAQGYGTRLADAVDHVLAEPMKPVTPQLQTAMELTPLAFGPLPPREKLETMAAANPNYQQRWASRMLKLMASADGIPKDYPYPVQAWRLGNELLWLTLGGEVVVDYSLRFKGEYGWDTWISGYSNDVMAYIPSERVLLEGGYEGQSSMFVYGQPCERWAPGVEERVAAAVNRVVQQASVSHSTVSE
ncbi:MAG: hypothetical protein B7Z55_16830 [Planctomycetales bacterium 12-60-4]|nr:MAG: hypothetical protein B7Z55_16830 [Planctomycetales bacterium 12-60-4]